MMSYAKTGNYHDKYDGAQYYGGSVHYTKQYTQYGNEYDYEQEEVYQPPAICRNYGSARGCRYAHKCYYSHDHPESVKICKFILKNKRCKSGNNCQYRHELTANDATAQNEYIPTVTIELLLELKVEYFQSTPSERAKVRYKASYRDKTDTKQQFNYSTISPSKLLQHLKNNNGHGVIADIGLFVQKKSIYSNNEWDKWLKSDNNAYDKLQRDEQTKIIIKIRELVNFYNANYKYLIKKFHPWTYYRTQIIVYGFINNHVRNHLNSGDTVKFEVFCPDEIMKLIFRFYYAVAKYSLFDYTNTVKVSDDNTMIESKRYLEIDQISLPCVIYKIQNFKFLRIRINKIPKDFMFSIGVTIPEGLKNMKGMRKNNDNKTWPFKRLDSNKHNRYQFYFYGNKDCEKQPDLENDKDSIEIQGHSFDDTDVYCGELMEGDILELYAPRFKELADKDNPRYYGYWYRMWKQWYIILEIKKRKKVFELIMPRDKEITNHDAYPAMAFNYIPEEQVSIEVLNVETDA